MTRKTFLLLFILPILAKAQTVEIEVADRFVTLGAEQTQTEIKPGWKIVDIQLKNKAIRYLSGRMARQLTDDQMPIFRLTPASGETLTDYAIIRLRQKRQYRILPNPILRLNHYQRIEPQYFSIKAIGDATFEFHPLSALEHGSYILVNIAQRPTGELEDYIVYPFQIP